MSGYNDSYSGGETHSGETMADTSPEVSNGENNENTVEKDSTNTEETTGKIEVGGNNVEASETSLGENAELVDSKEESEYEPQSRVKVDGIYYRTDDNGKIHMYRDDEDKTYKLIPNNEYTSHGYDYKTDDKGRISEAHGKLRVTDEERGALNAKVEDMKDGDERGHIISAKNDASDRVDNLVAMTKDLNDGEYKTFEKSLNDLVKEGHDVDVTYTPVYNEGNESKRPDGIAVTYTVDGSKDGENGETYCRVFDNTSREED